MSCDNSVDPAFYRAWMKSLRQKEKDPEYTNRKQGEFQGRTIDQIGDYLRAEGEIPSPTPSPESVCTRSNVGPAEKETPQVQA